ncbi:MAG: hypothetical protein ACJ0HV_00160 [Candidatus Pseudothioglobus sp.]
MLFTNEILNDELDDNALDSRQSRIHKERLDEFILLLGSKYSQSGYLQFSHHYQMFLLTLRTVPESYCLVSQGRQG